RHAGPDVAPDHIAAGRQHRNPEPDSGATAAAPRRAGAQAHAGASAAGSRFGSLAPFSCVAVTSGSHKSGPVVPKIKMRRPAAEAASSIPRFLFSVSGCGTTTLEPDLSGRANSRLGILLKNPTCGPGGGAAGDHKPVRTTRASVRTASGANSGSQAIQAGMSKG